MCYEWPFVYLFHLGDIESKMVKEITEEGGSLWRCQVCDYVTKQKGALFEHVESKHTLSVGYNCHVCGKFCPTRNALRSHVSRQHPRNTWNVKVIHNTQKCFHKVFKYYLHSIKYLSVFPALSHPHSLNQWHWHTLLKDTTYYASLFICFISNIFFSFRAYWTN